MQTRRAGGGPSLVRCVGQGLVHESSTAMHSAQCTFFRKSWAIASEVVVMVLSKSTHALAEYYG